MGDTQNVLVENKRIKTKEGKLPKYFDPANLTNLFVDQFVTCNEVHRKIIPGYDDSYVCTPYRDHIMKLLHDDNGKLDVSNGTYLREKVTLTKCKYTDESHLCLGVAVVTPIIDGVEKPQYVRR